MTNDGRLWFDWWFLVLLIKYLDGFSMFCYPYFLFTVSRMITFHDECVQKKKEKKSKTVFPNHLNLPLLNIPTYCKSNIRGNRVERQLPWSEVGRGGIQHECLPEVCSKIPGYHWCRGNWSSRDLRLLSLARYSLLSGWLQCNQSGSEMCWPPWLKSENSLLFWGSVQP